MVCGGLTPAYFDALCVDKNWLEYLTENNIPYGSFPAVTYVASEKAIIGGWRREVKNKSVQTRTKMRVKIEDAESAKRFGFGRFRG